MRRDPRFRAVILDHAAVIRDPEAAATTIDRFLGGGLNVAAMTEQVQPSLHRNRAGDLAGRDEPVAAQA